MVMKVLGMEKLGEEAVDAIVKLKIRSLKF